MSRNKDLIWGEGSSMRVAEVAEKKNIMLLFSQMHKDIWLRELEQ